MNIVNFIGLGIFAIIFLAVLAIISNTSQTSIANINIQFNRITCVLPSITGLWNSSGTIIYNPQSGNPTYNYPDKDNQTLTLTCTNVHTINGFDYLCGAPFSTFCGELIYVGDYLSEIMANKATAFFTIVFFILTPANFNILGFTIADLSGIPLMFLIAVYAICYIAIGAMLYKTLSPFSGGT